MAQDATKIYSGPVTALGIAAAGTADGGSFTDIGLLDEESSVNIEWEPLKAGLMDGNEFMLRGRGRATFMLVQTDPSGAQASLETYRTALAKLKIQTDTASETYFIDNVYVSYRLLRPFKVGEVHKLEVTVSRVTPQPDDFVDGPKTA